MGCVLDVVRGVLASIKRGHPGRGRGHSKFSDVLRFMGHLIVVRSGVFNSLRSNFKTPFTETECSEVEEDAVGICAFSRRGWMQ